MSNRPKTLGELRRGAWSEEKIAKRSVKQELRENLLERLEKGEPLFPVIHGYEESVIPQIVNALPSRATILFCWDCAARRRREFCAVCRRCWILRFPPLPGARLMTNLMRRFAGT